MARAASATPEEYFLESSQERGLWRLWPGEEKQLQLAQLHQDGGHPAGKVLLPIHQPSAAGEALHLSYVSFSDTNLWSVVWFGWQQPQQPQLLRNFMISRFNRSLVLRGLARYAPYGGHCVEKSLAPKSKYVDTPKTRLNKLSRSYHSNGVGHLKLCFYFSMLRKGFMSRSR